MGGANENPLLLPEDLSYLRTTFTEVPVHHFNLRVGGPFFEALKTPLGKRRRGEVVMAFRRGDGQVLLHTKSFYPPGTYRLLSGGLRRGETLSAGLRREVGEETGWPAHIQRFLSVISYQFETEEKQIDFVSYIFSLDAASLVPHPQDIGERISQFRWVPVAGLPQVAVALRSLPPAWQDWGCFRAIAHEVVAVALDAAAG